MAHSVYAWVTCTIREKYKVNTKSQITITHTHHKIKTCTHACDCAIYMYGEFLGMYPGV